MVFSSEVPTEPPSIWPTVTVADATPASCGATPNVPVLIAGAITMPRPIPARISGPRTPAAYPVCGPSWASQAVAPTPDSEGSSRRVLARRWRWGMSWFLLPYGSVQARIQSQKASMLRCSPWSPEGGWPEEMAEGAADHVAGGGCAGSDLARAWRSGDLLVDRKHPRHDAGRGCRLLDSSRRHRRDPPGRDGDQVVAVSTLGWVTVPSGGSDGRARMTTTLTIRAARANSAANSKAVEIPCASIRAASCGGSWPVRWNWARVAGVAVARNRATWSLASLRLAVPNTVTRIDNPSDPPTCCIAFSRPEAAPVSSRDTPETAMSVSGTNRNPRPSPNSNIGPSSPSR